MRSKHDNGHAAQTDGYSQPIPRSGPDAIDMPEPEYCHGYIDTTVRGVNTARSGGMERKQPCKHRQACTGREQIPGRSIVLQPELGQIAADDLGNRGNDEQDNGLQFKHP